jgi:hypothetical protein
LAVWKLALPNGANDDGNRFFCLRAGYMNNESGRDCCSNIVFRAASRQLRYHLTTQKRASFLLEDIQDRADMRNVSLLRACQESRGVFVHKFSRTLPASKGGLIRFDGETTFHVINFDSYFSPESLHRCTTLGHTLSSVFAVRKMVYAHIVWEHFNILGCLPFLSGLRVLKVYRRYVTNTTPLIPPEMLEDEWDAAKIEHFRLRFQREVARPATNPQGEVPDIEIF